MTVKAVAKLSPTPVGANFETTKEWIELKQWKAKALKAVGLQAWLLGFEQKVSDQWVSWGGQLMLITWQEPKTNAPIKTLVAGHTQW